MGKKNSNQSRFLSNAEVYHTSMKNAGFNDSYILNQIKYNYNVYNSKGLDPAVLDSGKLLDQLKRFKKHTLNKNDGIFVAFDKGKHTFRHKQFEGYKANRSSAL